MSKARAVFRVQDREGRGPYRPGMSDRWADPDGADHPPFFVEFGMGCIAEAPPGWAIGCAFISLDQMRAWFSAAECGRMANLGYRPVVLNGCCILRQSALQLVVTRRRPFRCGALLVAWPHIDHRAALDPWRAMEAADA